jgi:hypothetical protein
MSLENNQDSDTHTNRTLNTNQNPGGSSKDIHRKPSQTTQKRKTNNLPGANNTSSLQQNADLTTTSTNLN